MKKFIEHLKEVLSPSDYVNDTVEISHEELGTLIDLYIDEASEDTLMDILEDGSLKELMRYAIKKSSLAHMGFVVDIKDSIIDHAVNIESVVEAIHNENMEIERETV